MTSDVKKSEDVRVLLRVNWTDKSKEISFKPSQDLERNDKIKVTVEKV
jgi:hypothetical protein